MEVVKRPKAFLDLAAQSGPLEPSVLGPKLKNNKSCTGFPFREPKGLEGSTGESPEAVGAIS